MRERGSDGERRRRMLESERIEEMEQILKAGEVNNGK